jgi:SGNH hydrolase-like domain, acetyltransferase AlgX
MFKRTLMAGLQLVLGLAAGLLLLEAVLRLNPHLLLRGMAASAPIDAPLTASDYTIRYGDADLFFWHADLIHPLLPQQNQIEAQVHFETDEFGFPNAAPLPARADVVVLGRSFSQGTQAADPWPRQLAAATGWAVVDLAQPASGIGLKHQYLRQFGFPRQPRWVVLEVLPSMDIIGYGPDPDTQVGALPFPVAQTLLRRFMPAALPAPRGFIYPLSAHIGAQAYNLVFFSYYLAALSVSPHDLEASRQWAAYQQAVLDLAADARAHGSCVALLYAPTKEELFFSLASQPQELAPALTAGWAGWRLAPDGNLAQDAAAPGDAAQLQSQAGAARALVAGFAASRQLVWVDPTAAMQAAAQHGDDPFMTYDSHWSASGHAIVAAAVAQALQSHNCP